MDVIQGPYELMVARLPIRPKCGIYGCFLLLISGCFPVGETCATALTVRGELRDAETGEAIADTPIGGRTITDGLITSGGPAVDQHGEPVMAFTEADGSFALKFDAYFYDADVPNPCEFTMPDRVQVIVARAECEQRLIIAIDETTARFIDREYSDDALEFLQPVLVPPCDEAP